MDVCSVARIQKRKLVVAAASKEQVTCSTHTSQETKKERQKGPRAIVSMAKDNCRPVRDTAQGPEPRVQTLSPILYLCPAGGQTGILALARKPQLRKKPRSYRSAAAVQ